MKQRHSKQNNLKNVQDKLGERIIKRYEHQSDEYTLVDRLLS